jgi:hypothetical protein
MANSARKAISFSIYFALKEHRASVEIKYGFIFLILSMRFGLFSIHIEIILQLGLLQLKKTTCLS